MDRHDRNNVKSMIKAAITEAEGRITNGVNMLHMGLMQTQQRLTSMWNTWNVHVRMLEYIGIEQGWWKDREEYQALFVKLGEELYEESKAHHESEMARIQSEQADGKEPLPMTPVDLRDGWTGLSAAAKAERKPLPPEELFDAKSERVHREPGRARAARTVRNKRRGSS